MTWYKQEGELVPFTAWPWMSVINTLRTPTKKYQEIRCYLTEDYLEVYWLLQGMQDVSRAVYTKYKGRKIDVAYHLFCAEAKKLEKLYLQAHGMPDLTEKKIIPFFKKIFAQHQELWRTSLFIDSFDPGFDQEEIERLAKEHGISDEDAGILTTPLQLTYTSERALEFLHLLKQGITSVAHSQMQEHMKKWDFYQYSYSHMKHLTKEQVAEEIEDNLNNTTKMNTEYQELANYTHNQQKKERAILQKYGLSENPFYFFQKLTFWREHRKKSNMMGVHILHHFLEILAEKVQIEKKYLEYLNYDEVEAVLQGNITREELRRRREQGVLLRIYEKQYDLFVGQEATKRKEELEGIISQGFMQQLRGYVACKGKATGTVKIIINRQDFQKFKEGDVLVAGMTRPEHVPLMKKAAAIVTNEGGITCHAAIVSRELNKPCIIGTKVATKALKDGEFVEVNANHGIIRKLPPFKAIIFDFSGVCSNTEEPLYLRKFAKKYGLDERRLLESYDELIFKAERDEISGEDVWQELAKRYRLSLDVPIVITEMLAMKELDHEMLRLAGKLKQKYLTAVFTNYNQTYWKIISHKEDLSKFFTTVQVSYQVKARKTEEIGFQVLLQKLGVQPSEAVFIDDSKGNLLAPKKLGLTTIHFHNQQQLLEDLKKLGIVV